MLMSASSSGIDPELMAALRKMESALYLLGWALLMLLLVAVSILRAVFTFVHGLIWVLAWSLGLCQLLLQSGLGALASQPALQSLFVK